MKRYLLIIPFLFSFLAYSQVAIENGHVGKEGDFIFESSTALKENFTWKVMYGDSTVNCFMQDGEELVDVLIWKLKSVEVEENVTRYLVLSNAGVSYYLDFLNDGKSVIIFNTENLQYSVMSGEGVFYTLN